jgi:hypothetical protein
MSGYSKFRNGTSVKHIDDCFTGLAVAVFHGERKDFCSYTVFNGVNHYYSRRSQTFGIIQSNLHLLIQTCCKEFSDIFGKVGNESLIQKEQFLFLTNTILVSRRFGNHDRICVSTVLQASKEVSIVPYFNNNNNSVCSVSSLSTGRQWCKLPSINYKVSKSKYAKSRVTYYSNSVASYQLLLIAGDVHPQPGPSAGEKTRVKQTTVKCPQCEKTVKCNHKRVECDKCFDLFHIRCVYSNSWFIKNTGAVMTRVVAL